MQLCRAFADRVTYNFVCLGYCLLSHIYMLMPLCLFALCRSCVAYKAFRLPTAQVWLHLILNTAESNPAHFDRVQKSSLMSFLYLLWNPVGLLLLWAQHVGFYMATSDPFAFTDS